ncbi:hypothetical protein HK104_011161 [Borealophlyctis nickersoniae]|nr:hypothetical protein HK104_011161 [Borealophlyctis nickersoniae]
MQLLLTALLAFLAFTTLTAAQFPDCLPTDVVCRVQKSQYTVLGTVVSVTSNTTASDYNATVLIQCVYASVDPTVNTGANIIGQQVLITGFGPARAGCPSNTGATVKVGTSYIFFLFGSGQLYRTKHARTLVAIGVADSVSFST